MLVRHDRDDFGPVKYPATARTRRVLRLSAVAASLIVLLALAWRAYHPGLSGAFLFDDLGSLPKLGDTGPVDHWATFWRYITSGSADPTGRPLALLSFLIDAHDWPANPYPFKLTNVILHLLNGALLAWVLWKLGRVLPASDTCTLVRGVNVPPPRGEGKGRGGFNRNDTSPHPHPNPPLEGEGARFPTRKGSARGRFKLDDRGIAIAALFGAGAWLLHPLLVSTTLYIVQREAMLAATFTLLGMLGWMASREALARGHVKRGLSGMALSAWLCTGLAVLSKANGALLPLLLLLTEWIVLSRRPMPTAGSRRLHQRAMAAFLVLPSALVIAYLLYLIPGAIRSAPGIRGWSVGQRLLTEPRVLADYLRLLFVPHAYSSGLFNDAFPVSTGWLHPASTLPCIVLVLALIGAGFALRKKHPAIALALLFYFAAQLMESGWIPLELYYEHRNYLPAMLLFWPIGLALGAPGALRFLRMLAAAIVLAVLAALTVQRTRLWGDAPRQAQVWAAINPDSARAQTSAALYDLQSGRPRLAAARLQLAMPKHPDNLQIPVNLVTAQCRLGVVQSATLDAADTALANDRVGEDVAFNWFGEALTLVRRHACTGLGYADLQGLLDAARRNPHWRDRKGMRVDDYHLQGALELAQQRPRQALEDFNLALKQAPQPGTALSQAATLASAGYPELGLAHLDYFNTLPKPHASGFGMQRIHAWVLQRQNYWQHEMAHLRKALQAAAAAPAERSAS